MSKEVSVTLKDICLGIEERYEIHLNKIIVTFIKENTSGIMDIQAEKLYLMEQLAKLQDAEIIQKIKDILSKQPQPVAGYNPGGEEITPSKLIARAKASNKAIKNGELTSIEELENESEGW